MHTLWLSAEFIAAAEWFFGEETVKQVLDSARAANNALELEVSHDLPDNDYPPVI